MELDGLVAYLITKYNPKAIIIHGSRARGDELEQSDYDLCLITKTPELPRPEIYNGCSLDISGVSPTEMVLKMGKTPIWPCLVLFDDVDRLGEGLVKQTHEAFKQGPPPLERALLKK